MPAPDNSTSEIRKIAAFERGQVILAAVVLVVGAVGGWAVPKLFDDPKNLRLWLVGAAVLLVAVAATAGLGFINLQRGEAKASLRLVEGRVAEMAEVNKQVQELLEESIGRQASLIPRDLVYRDMATCIRNAQREVAVITYLMVDWETGKRTFMPAEADTPHRGEFYDAIYEAIKNPRIEYVRVWEVPHDRRDEALEVINSEEHNAKECALIEQVEKSRPDRARLIIANQLTTASFILIDRRNLFLNIDFFDPEQEVWYSPYMLFIKDATGEAFEELQSVIVRLVSPR